MKLWFCIFLMAGGSVFAQPTTLTFRLYAQPASLDWNLCYATSQSLILENIMQGLFGVNRDFAIQPVLVKTWHLSADRKVYTFKIRKEVEWSDGRRLSAQDFVFSWRRLLTPETASSNATLLEAVEGATAFNSGKQKDFAKVGIRALDDETIEVRLSRPVYNWQGVLAAVSTYPMREDKVRAFAADWWHAENLVTLGPYMLSEAKAEERIVLVSNPRYRGKRGGVARAVALILDLNQTAVSLFAAKKLDIALNLQPLDVKSYEGQPELHSFSSVGIEYLGFVVDKPGPGNLHLRRAIARAIDKGVFAKALGSDLTPTNRFIPSLVEPSPDPLGLPFDETAARKELKLSGWSGKTPLKLVVGGTGDGRSVAEALQFQIQTHLGVKVEIQMLELRAARASRLNHTGELFLGGMAPDYADVDSYLTFFFDHQNFTLWKSDRFEQLVKMGQLATDQKEKFRQDLRAEQLMLEEAPIVPLFFQRTEALIRQGIENVELAPFGILHLAEIEMRKQ